MGTQVSSQSGPRGAGQAGTPVILAVLLTGTAILLVGCGGGGGGGGAGVVPTTVTLQGTITDPWSSGAGATPVPNATVSLQGTPTTVTANGAGSFSGLVVPANSQVTLVITNPSYLLNPYDDTVATGAVSPQNVNPTYAFSLPPPPP